MSAVVIRRNEKRTVSIHDKKSGHFLGRKQVSEGGDSTRVMRFRRNLDIDKNGEPDYFKGQVAGRVKGSSHQRGYKREI